MLQRYLAKSSPVSPVSMMIVSARTSEVKMDHVISIAYRYIAHHDISEWIDCNNVQ